MLVFDIEASDLDASRLNLLMTYDGVLFNCYSDSDIGIAKQGTIKDGLDALLSEDVVVGHNIFGWDLPALKKHFGDAVLPLYKKARDTLVMGRLWRPKIEGGHSLAAWAERFGGVYKVHIENFATATWSDLIARCKNDLIITMRLYSQLCNVISGLESAEKMENRIAEICTYVEAKGFRFDEKAAINLFIKYQDEKASVLKELQEKYFPIQYVDGGEKVYKVINKKHPFYGILEPGTPINIVIPEEFTGSRQQAARRLIKKYNWKPEYTEGGVPILDDIVLSKLEFPEAKLLSRYYELEKLCAFIHNPEAKTGWLNYAKNGRVHANYIPSATYTHRMACYKPNLQQVPRIEDIRSLWLPDEGQVLVGIDAKSLELRILAHYVCCVSNTPASRAWADNVTQGDIHSVIQKELGCWSRDTAKRIVYALSYGAGNKKLGNVWLIDDKANYGKSDWYPRLDVLGITTEDPAKIGQRIRDNEMVALVSMVNERAEKHVRRNNGWMPGLDGRRVYHPTDKTYSCVATLCQSGGAIVMKYALCFLYKKLRELPSGAASMVAIVHDEWQLTCAKEYATLVAEAGVQSIKDAGKFLSLKVDMDGSFKIGESWKDTH